MLKGKCSFLILVALSVNSCSKPERRFLGTEHTNTIEADLTMLTSDISLPAGGLMLTGNGQPVVILTSAKGKVDGYHAESVDLAKVGERSFGVSVPRRFALAELQILELSLTIDGSPVILAAGAANPAVVQGIQWSFDGHRVQAGSRKIETRIVVKVGSADKSGSIEIVGADSLCYDATVEQKLEGNRDIVEATVRLGAGWSGMPVSSQPASAIFNGISGGDLGPTASWQIDIDQLAIGSNLVQLKIESEAARCDLDVVVEVEQEPLESPSPNSPASSGAKFAAPFGDAEGNLLPLFQSMPYISGVNFDRSCPDKINLDGFADWQKIVLVADGSRLVPAQVSGQDYVIGVECWVKNTFCVNGTKLGERQTTLPGTQTGEQATAVAHVQLQVVGVTDVELAELGVTTTAEIRNAAMGSCRE